MSVETDVHIVGLFPLDTWKRLLKDAGFTDADIGALSGRELGIAVAQAMFALADRIEFPTTLQQVEGFSREHIDRALTAAKNPQLKMKLQNMPVPLTPEMIDEYMGPVLEAASSGDLSLIKNAVNIAEKLVQDNLREIQREN